jgi:AraC-like DNA-binding protein
MKNVPRLPDMPPSGPEFFSRQVREAQRFYLDLAPSAEEPMVVVCGGSECCAANYAIRRETFPYLAIEFVAGGKGTLNLAGREVDLSPGVVFAYGPGIPQQITTDAARPLVKYFIDFAGRWAEQLMEQHLPLGSVGRVFVIGEIQDIFDELIRNGLKVTQFSTRLCNILLEYLILKIAESLMPWEATETAAFATFQRCRQYIRSHCGRLKSLDQVALECHVDRAYLCRIFQRFARQTPYQFLLRLKMNLAAERLQDPATLVKEVAFELGFVDPFHFSRVFKRLFGLSPEAFRRLQ